MKAKKLLKASLIVAGSVLTPFLFWEWFWFNTKMSIIIGKTVEALD